MEIFGYTLKMSQIQEIKQATDLVQLIAERFPLQRSGTNWRGLCPFHSEKSPSFFVSEQLQRYKCFGCAESGDVFTFLEKYDGMTFAEALQYLADRAGITLTKVQFSAEDDQRKRQLEILNLTKEYYHFLLTKHEVGEPARQYLKERGATQESLKVFQIGYALPSWDSLLKYLHQKKKYNVADILGAGLIIENSTGRTYDRFRDRIMFPLTDHRGRVVGFSGRVLNSTEKEAKYINTPETALYHKSQLLYGFSQLYQEIRKENEIVIVEGEFDVISSAQAHVNHISAVKGSALTEEHMKLLSRTVTKVILSFDQDKAGIAATKRAIEVAKPYELELRVIDFQSVAQDQRKKDPDDLARTQPQLWRQLVKSTISIYEFLIQAAAQQHDPQTPEGKRKIIDELAPVIGNISHAVELEYYVTRLAQLLQVKESIVRTDLQRFKAKKIMGRNSQAIAPSSERKEVSEQPVESDRKSRLEDYVLFLFFQSAPEVTISRALLLREFSFTKVGVKQIIEQLLQQKGEISLAEFAGRLAEDLQKTLFDLTYQTQYLDLLPNIDLDKEWKKSLTELKEIQVSKEVERIQAELDEIDRKSQKIPEDETRQSELLHQVVKLRSAQSTHQKL